MLQYYFSLRQFQLTKWSFFIHSTTPYIHQRLDSQIGPWDFRIEGSCWSPSALSVSSSLMSLSSALTLHTDQDNMGLAARIPVFGVSNKASFKSVSLATETS